MNNVPTTVNRLLAGIGVKLVRTSQASSIEANGPSFTPLTLPSGAMDVLHSGNPRLIELKERYRDHSLMRHSIWKDSYLDSELDLAHFRGDNAYVWQKRAMATDSIRVEPRVQYALTTYYAKEIDQLGLLDRFEEDGLFGALTFQVSNKLTVSRDMLDSILEINFLERHLHLSKIPSLKVLDIGAGYGRLGHRFAAALPNLKQVFCTDAVAESTFLAEYYLNFRGVSDRAKATPLDELEGVLKDNPVHVATNIESFSECTIDSITWWLDLLARHRVPYLMIVPNFRDLLVSAEPNGIHVDFRSHLEARGFELMATEPIYEAGSCVSAYGVYPNRCHLLFRNKNVADRS